MSTKIKIRDLILANSIKENRYWTTEVLRQHGAGRSKIIAKIATDNEKTGWPHTNTPNEAVGLLSPLPVSKDTRSRKVTKKILLEKFKVKKKSWILKKFLQTNIREVSVGVQSGWRT